MSLTISFESDGVLVEQKQFAKLDALMASALQQKRPVVLDLGSKQVGLGDTADRGNKKDTVLRGQRISAEITICKPTFRMGICLPLLVEIQQIQLPPGSFATFGRPGRPLADFFMRNIFHAALRSRLRFDPARATAPELSRDLQRCYVWMLRTQFRDALLQDVEPTELLLKACHFGIDLVDSPFFGKAAEDIRQRTIKNMGRLGRTADLGRLMWLRSQLMSEY